MYYYLLNIKISSRLKIRLKKKILFIKEYRVRNFKFNCSLQMKCTQLNVYKLSDIIFKIKRICYHEVIFLIF